MLQGPSRGSKSVSTPGGPKRSPQSAEEVSKIPPEHAGARTREEDKRGHDKRRPPKTKTREAKTREYESDRSQHKIRQDKTRGHTTRGDQRGEVI